MDKRLLLNNCHCKSLWLCCLSLAVHCLWGCSTAEASEVVQPSTDATVKSGDPVTVYDAAQPDKTPPPDPCESFDAESGAWLDRTQVGLYETVCSTAAWFDGFFGDVRYDQRTAETYGRLSLGGAWDERDGFDPRLRFRARFALPALREGGNFFLGRGDDRQVVEESGVERRDELAPVTGQSEDDSVFAGFGFSRSRSLERGFDFDVGVRVRLPPEPFVKAKYRYGMQLSENTLMRLFPVAYWRLEEKFGATLGIDLDHIVSDRFLLRFSNFGNVSEDPEIEGLAWGSSVTLYQAMSNRRALVYSTFVSGETDAAVQLRNYGYEMRYRQRILREWLFIEYLGSVSWPRESPTEQRETNFGVGLRFEIYFGPAPDDWVR